MNKTIVIAATAGIVVVGGVFGIAPIVVSKVVENNFEQAANEISSKSNIQLTDVEYQASLTGGTAYTTYQPYGDSGELQIKLKHEISTMPFFSKTNGSSGFGMAYIKTTLADDNFSEETIEKLNTAFNNQAPMLLETVMDYGGNYNVSVTVNPAKLEDAEGSLDFSGLKGEFKVAKGGTKVTGDAHAQSLSMNTKDTNLQFNNFSSAVDQSTNAHGLWIGKSDAKIETINAQTAMGEFSINGVSMDADTAEQNDTLNYLLNLVVAEVISPEGFPLAPQSMNYQIKFTNIDSAAVAQLSEALQEMQRQIPTNTPEQNEVLGQEFGMQNIGAIDQMLYANPAMAQNLNIDTNQGPVKVDFNLDVSGFPQDQSVKELMSPMELVRYMTGSLDAKVPMAVIMMTPLGQQLQAYQQQGLVKVDGDTAQLQANLKDGQLMVNDNPMPLPF